MKEFSKPWMARCNPDLIIRLWRHKGSPGQLNILLHGVRLLFYNTPFGEVCLKCLYSKINIGENTYYAPAYETVN